MSRIANVKTTNGGEGRLFIVGEFPSGIIASYQEDGPTFVIERVRILSVDYV